LSGVSASCPNWVCCRFALSIGSPRPQRHASDHDSKAHFSSLPGPPAGIPSSPSTGSSSHRDSRGLPSGCRPSCRSQTFDEGCARLAWPCVVSRPTSPLAATSPGASASNTASTNLLEMESATHRRSIRASAAIARGPVLLLLRAADCAPSQSCRSPHARGSVFP
jgi:hypothetical protein